MDGRAQTQLDFLIGTIVFLLVVGFVFSFVPTMTEPFEETSGSDLQIADRSAAHLADYALGSDGQHDAPQRPAVMNAGCVRAFFGGESAEDCRYDSTELHTELGVDERTTNVRVRIDGDRITEQRGDDDPSGTVAVSSRIVSIEGESHELTVRVW